MKWGLWLGILLIWCGVCWAETPSAEEILKKIDDNLTTQQMISTSSMVIHSARGSRTIESKSWSRGNDTAFTEYLAPAREKGVKMLKLQDNLWIYYPNADRIVKISGHMLRQSVMGSDLSYEDMMDNATLTDSYQALVESEEKFNDRLCWIVKLDAKTPDVTYQQRRLWVDQERFLPLKEELLTKQGKLLKVIEMRKVQQIEGRWYYQEVWFKDMLKDGQGTEWHLSEIQFDPEIPERQFSKSALRR